MKTSVFYVIYHMCLLWNGYKKAMKFDFNLFTVWVILNQYEPILNSLDNFQCTPSAPNTIYIYIDIRRIIFRMKYMKEHTWSPLLHSQIIYFMQRAH